MDRTPVEIWQYIIQIALRQPSLDLHNPKNLLLNTGHYRFQASEDLEKHRTCMRRVCASWNKFIMARCSNRTVVVRRGRTFRRHTPSASVEILQVDNVEFASVEISNIIPLYPNIASLRLSLVERSEAPYTTTSQWISNLLVFPKLRALSISIPSVDHIQQIATTCPQLIALHLNLNVQCRRQFLPRTFYFEMRYLEILSISSPSLFDPSNWNFPKLRHFYFDTPEDKLPPQESMMVFICDQVGSRLESLSLQQGRFPPFFLASCPQLHTLYTNLDATTPTFLDILSKAAPKQAASSQISLRLIVHTAQIQSIFVESTLIMWGRRAQEMRARNPNGRTLDIGFARYSWRDIIDAAEKGGPMGKLTLGGCVEKWVCRDLIRRAEICEGQGLRVLDALGGTILETRESPKQSH